MWLTVDEGDDKYVNIVSVICLAPGGSSKYNLVIWSRNDEPGQSCTETST